jgi:hypothetical protein
MPVKSLQNILQLQCKKDTKYFSKGMFASYRTNTFLNLNRPDDNIFFSVSTLYILKSLQPYISQEEQSIISEIEKNLIPNFKLYSNNTERHSYNFWQKSSLKHFPNGALLHKLKKFQLPDDIDTTSMVQMVGNYDKSKALKTKNTLPHHANHFKLSIKNGHPQLRHYQAYSTWFGKNMPIEFDVCVLCNLLLWIHHFNLDINKNDEATIQLIEETINKSLYFTSAFRSAPEYPRDTIILYHISRVIAQTTFLSDHKNKIIKDLKSIENRKSNTPLDRLLLSNSLLKLGERPLSSILIRDLEGIKNNWWFTAGFLSVYSNSILQKLAPHPLFHFRFYCPGFNMALWYENLVLINC